MANPANIGVLEGFRVEFLKCWQRLPHKAVFFLLLIVWLGLFHVLGASNTGVINTPSLLKWMYLVSRPNSTMDRDDSHALLIPVVVLGLFWWKRKHLLAADLRSWMPGLLIL